MTNPGPDATPNNDLIAVRTFASAPEAEIAKGALEAFGIDCMLTGDDCGGQRPHLAFAGIGIQLIVRSEDLEKAEEALTSPGEAPN